MQSVVLCVYLTVQTVLSYTFAYLLSLSIYSYMVRLYPFPPSAWVSFFSFVHSFLPLYSLYPFLPFLLLLHLAAFFCILMLIVFILEVPYVFGFNYLWRQFIPSLHHSVWEAVLLNIFLPFSLLDLQFMPSAN